LLSQRLRNNSTCAAIEAPERSMLGEAQRRWLLEGLASSPARWRGLVSAVMFSPRRSGSIVINADGCASMGGDCVTCAGRRR
jgi:alkaline phosphatase D